MDEILEIIDSMPDLTGVFEILKDCRNNTFDSEKDSKMNGENFIRAIQKLKVGEDIVDQKTKDDLATF